MLAAVLACHGRTSFADSLAVQLIKPALIHKRLEAGLVSERERRGVIAHLFEESGCTTQLVSINKHLADVVCTLPGQMPGTIILGGHLDFVEAGKGIVDDWSGTALLPSLYGSMKLGHPRHRFEFIAFDGEERGLLGSERFVHEMNAEQRANTRAFANLECLGVSTPKVWVHRSNPMLVRLLAQVAVPAHIPLQEVDVERVGDDDTHPFLLAKIPVISIHSLTQENWRILHSPRDKLDAVQPAKYYDTYRLIAFYLAFLDNRLE